MLLRSLANFARLSAGGLPPLGYRSVRVRWWIDIDIDGSLCSVTNASHEQQASRWLPYVRSTSDIQPRPFADRAAHALGPRLLGGATVQSRTVVGHARFVDLVQRCADDTGDPFAGAVAKFLICPPEPTRDLSSIPPDDVCAFRVDGVVPTDCDAVKAWWAACLNRGEIARCHLCGCTKAIARVHPSFRGVPGAVTAGAVLVSANQASAESCGLRQGMSAATCLQCTHEYSAGLAMLLASEQASLRLPQAQLCALAWTDDGRASPMVKAIGHGVSHPYMGPYAADAHANLCFTALSASGGRIAVRDWLVLPESEASRNVSDWGLYWRQRLEGGPPPLRELLAVLAPPAVTVPAQPLSSHPPSAAIALLRSAIAGQPLSLRIAHLAARRKRIGHLDARQQRLIDGLVDLVGPERATRSVPRPSLPGAADPRPVATAGWLRGEEAQAEAVA